MMKILNVNGEQYQSEKIIKTGTDIVGEDANGNEVFAFRGISDFTGFEIINEDGIITDYDTISKTELELLKETVDALVLANLGV